MSSAERDPRFPRSWPAPVERLADRANPILVKEVRQALRGQYFRLIFWLTLSGATVIGLVVLMSLGGNQEPRGTVFFQTIFACLAVAAHGFVPFSAFVAMGSEWDENTFDLLVLSNLRPRQIVLGKLLSAGIQALLLYSAFGPFLVFAFLLGGVDLLAILVVLGGSMLLSLALSATAIALSTTTQSKFLRVIAMAGLAAFLAWITLVSLVAGAAVMQSSGELREPRAWLAIAAVVSVGLVYIPLPLAQACARLSHPEENRSSALRLLAWLLAAVGLGWGAYLHSRDPSRGATLALTLTAQLYLALSTLIFLSEPLRLGRRARLGIPRSRALALLTLPLQPGSARALLWFLCGSLAAWLWFLAVNQLWPDGTQPLGLGQVVSPLVASLFGLVYLGLPALLASERKDVPRARIVIRLLPPALAAFGILVPGIFGFFAGWPGLQELAHGANPAWVLIQLWEGDVAKVAVALAVLGLAALFVLGLNSRRLGRAFGETLAASAENRARTVRPRPGTSAAIAASTPAAERT